MQSEMECFSLSPLCYENQVQDILKMPQDVQRWPLDGPKTASRRPKTAPRRPQDGLRRPQDDPRRPQDGPRTAQEAPRRTQDGAETSHESVLLDFLMIFGWGFEHQLQHEQKRAFRYELCSSRFWEPKWSQVGSKMGSNFDFSENTKKRIWN